MPPVETPATHPGLHLWLKDRGIGNTAAAALLGVSRETVRLWRLPFTAALRRKPQDDDQLAQVIKVTEGAVTAADFYPPHLRADPPADPRGGRPDVLRAGRSS